MIGHLNEVPQLLIHQARSLGDAVAAKELLVRHTGPECWDYLEPFVEDVVFGEEAVRDWMRDQVIVPDFSLADQLCLSRAQLLAPLGGACAQRITPSQEDWREGAPWIGAPARVLLDADYRTDMPDQAVGLGTVETEEVEDPVVALRRWIAARLAAVAWLKSSEEASDRWIDAQEGLPRREAWSQDARRAGRALGREYEELGPPEDAIPGMRGPDEWYAS